MVWCLFVSACEVSQHVLQRLVSVGFNSPTVGEGEVLSSDITPVVPVRECVRVCTHACVCVCVCMYASVCMCVYVCGYLELVLDLARVGLRVQPADVVVDSSELTHWDGCVPTQTRLQDGIVHKHILLLETNAGACAHTSWLGVGAEDPKLICR